MTTEQLSSDTLERMLAQLEALEQQEAALTAVLERIQRDESTTESQQLEAERAALIVFKTDVRHRLDKLMAHVERSLDGCSTFEDRVSTSPSSVYPPRQSH